MKKNGCPPKAGLDESHCEGSGISIQTLIGGSRQRQVSKVRRELACRT